MLINTELGPISRLVAGTPPAIADRLKSVLRADNVMTHADMAARNGYTRQIAVNSKEIQ
ncbi:MAG: hypothetical protein JOY55_02050 [Mycobacterium sp.]|nr:hypothetical protein [Mycobacterium sp.]